MLDQIIKKMIETVDHSKLQIFEINENARKEFSLLSKELNDIKEQVEETISTTDRLESRGRMARIRLAQVSKHFQEYSEAEIREAYEEANDYQVQLSVVQEKEKQLRDRRDDIERRIRSIEETVKKADDLISQVSVVSEYLTGDLRKMGEMIEDAKEKQTFGLKIIEAQEDERKRLSREIHDGPAQQLAHVLISSELIERIHKEKGPDASLDEMKRFKSMVRNALYEVRRIIYDLRPMSLDDLGLVPTLEKYFTRVREQYPGTELRFNYLGDEERLPSRMEAALFRLVQEGLQNACKHAHAKLIKVSLEITRSTIHLLIHDDGIGFELSKGKNKENSFGLMGMKERVEMLDGKITINSAENKGTRISIRIPIVREEEL